MAALSLPPGRMGWLPWVGEGIAFLRSPFGFFAERVERYGPIFRTRIFGNRMIAIAGADAFELVNDSSRVTRVGASPGFLERLFDPSAVPFLSGEPHLARRALLARGFTADAIEGYRPLVRDIIDRHLVTWVGAGEVVGDAIFDRLGWDLANALFFAAEPGADEPELEAAFHRYEKGFASAPINLWFTKYGKALRARDRLREHCAARLAARPAGDHALGHLAGGDDDRVVVIELVHALTVAQQALHAGLVDVTRALQANPSLAERARAAAAAGDRGYLDQFTREARRYYKILPVTGISQLLRDVELGGYRLPEGWKVVAIIYASMWDPKVVDRPEVFDPDRFAEGVPPYYLAHGGGPMTGHRCAGEALADLVLASYLEVVLPRHRLEFPDQDLSEKKGGFAPLPVSGLRTRYLPIEAKAA